MQPRCASTHDEAWRSAYQGIIPGAELEKLINRRGPQWWDSAIRKGSRVSVLVFGDKVAGYANTAATAPAACTSKARSTSSICGRNSRASASAAALSPPPARLVQSGLKSMVIWALSDNDPRRNSTARSAAGMVPLLGEVRAESLDKVAFAWTN
jgi:hypothetical protein